MSNNGNINQGELAHSKRMGEINVLLHKYTTGNQQLFDTLFRHSRQVADKALIITKKHPELKANAYFVEEAAMLHDIGIVFTNAPAIFCYGKEPYIKHGLLGAEILERENMSEYARVCACHTGTGLTEKDIVLQNLPLPKHDFIPLSIEEQIICFADKFFSKTKIDTEKTIEQVRASLKKFGDESVAKFDKWCDLFL